MNALQACPAPTRALRRLAAFLHESGSKLSAVDAATMAINQWIAMEKGQLTSVVATPTRGYQWKTLFLPEGTELRISFERENFYARVEGDNLIYQGRPVSPRQMAISVAGEGRNAWREVWVLLPGERKWYPASLLRRQATQQEPARQVSPQEAMHAAAACMSETLKSALALVEHVGSRAAPAGGRPVSRRRRAEDVLGDSIPFDE